MNDEKRREPQTGEDHMPETRNEAEMPLMQTANVGLAIHADPTVSYAS